MKIYKTIFYDYEAGVEFYLRWANEKQYDQAVGFLRNLTGSCLQESASVSEVSSYFLLNDRGQVNALYEFRKKILYGEE